MLRNSHLSKYIRFYPISEKKNSIIRDWQEISKESLCRIFKNKLCDKFNRNIRKGSSMKTKANTITKSSLNAQDTKKHNSTQRHMITPSPLAVSNDLGKKAGEAIANAINPLVADAFALYVKTKNFHWHLSGSHFRDYHLLFDEQADQIFEMIDVLAERVRKVGGLTIHSVQQIAQLQSVKDDNDEFVNAQEMVRRLFEENKNYTNRMREAHKVCEDNDDVATTSILEIFIDETERRAWFLFETMQNK